MRRIELLGEPKSGTTMVEAAVFALAQEACSPPSLACTPVGTLDQKRIRSFELLLNGSQAVGFSERRKHSIPYGGRRRKGKEGCQHPEKLEMHKPPCGLKGADLHALRSCARSCAAAGVDASAVYLHIFRDPRNQVISACFWEKGPGMTTASLERCVRRSYLTVALWVRFRQLLCRAWQPQMVPLSYEVFVARPVDELAKVAGALGLAVEKGGLARVEEALRPENVVKRFDMHDRRTGAPKVRSAGRKGFRDYGLSRELTEWMDDVHARLEVQPSGFCG